MYESSVFTKPAVDFLMQRAGWPPIVAQGVVTLFIVLVRVGWSYVPTISKTEGEILVLEEYTSRKRRDYRDLRDLDNLFFVFDVKCMNLRTRWNEVPKWNLWVIWAPPADMSVKLLDIRFREEIRARLASIAANNAQVYPW